MSYPSIAKTFIHVSLSRITVIILTICVFADLGFGSPLLFKVTRTIDSGEYIELGVMHTTLIKQIRIGVNIASTREVTAGDEHLAECQLEIVGVVDNEEVILHTLSERVASRSFIIETPPATIRLKAKGKGKFSVYIWAQ